MPINQFSLQVIIAEKILGACAAREGRAAETIWTFSVSSNAGRTKYAAARNLLRRLRQHQSQVCIFKQ